MNTFTTFYTHHSRSIEDTSSSSDDEGPILIQVPVPSSDTRFYHPHPPSSPIILPDFFLLVYIRHFLLTDRQLFDYGFPVGNLLDYGIFHINNPWAKPPTSDSSNLRSCTRCSQNFDPVSSFPSSPTCFYHWGKLVYNPDFGSKTFTCCMAPAGLPGCTSSLEHVWSGVTQGLNGPFPGYVRTSPNAIHSAIYALDCEMCYTTAGLEATKVTVVGPTGTCVYDRFIRPTNRIIDYNTRFSGVSKENLVGANTLAEVQQELLEFISSETVLVGHGIENDMRALKMLHRSVVDTAVIFPHERGFPYRKSLKVLVKDYLGRDIQACAAGHNSEEDAREAMALTMYAISSHFL